MTPYLDTFHVVIAPKFSSPQFLSALPPPSLPVHTCPHLADPLQPPVRADTNFEHDMEFFNKSQTPYIHLHHPFTYTNTKKVSHKVKYLLTTLMQNENRERINIYLKYPMEIEKNK